MKRLLVVFSLFVSALKVSASGIPVVDVANNIQSGLNLVESVAQTIGQASQLANEATQITNQVSQIQHQLDQIDNQIKSLKNLDSYNWQDYVGILNQLNSAAQRTNALAFTTANLAAEYELYNDRKHYEGASVLYQERLQAEARWARHSDATVESSAAILSQQYQDLVSDGSELNDLQAASSNVEGEVQAMQAGNQLQAFTSKQLMQLRGLLMSQQQMMIQDRAQRAEREAMQAAASQRAKRVPVDTPSQIY